MTRYRKDGRCVRVREWEAKLSFQTFCSSTKKTPENWETVRPIRTCFAGKQRLSPTGMIAMRKGDIVVAVAQPCVQSREREGGREDEFLLSSHQGSTRNRGSRQKGAETWSENDTCQNHPSTFLSGTGSLGPAGVYLSRHWLKAGCSLHVLPVSAWVPSGFWVLRLPTTVQKDSFEAQQWSGHSPRVSPSFGPVTAGRRLQQSMSVVMRMKEEKRGPNIRLKIQIKNFKSNFAIHYWNPVQDPKVLVSLVPQQN